MHKLYLYLSIFIIGIGSIFSVKTFLVKENTVSQSTLVTLASASVAPEVIPLASEETLLLPNIDTTVAEDPSTTTPPTPVHPARVIIPSLGVDAKVTDVGITEKGLMDVPKNFTDVGWYKYGSMPGEVGNAVLDGHLNNGSTIDGVFKNLAKLSVGDSIFVVGDDGRKLEFVMKESKLYDRDASTEEIFTKDGPPELRIITCEGKWLIAKRTHERRRVVTAVLKGESEG